MRPSIAWRWPGPNGSRAQRAHGASRRCLTPTEGQLASLPESPRHRTHRRPPETAARGLQLRVVDGSVQIRTCAWRYETRDGTRARRSRTRHRTITSRAGRRQGAGGFHHLRVAVQTAAVGGAPGPRPRREILSL